MAKCFVVCLIVLFAFVVIVSLVVENRQLGDIKSIKRYGEVQACYANLVVLEKEICVESDIYRVVYIRPEFPSLASGCRVLIFNCYEDCIDRTVDVSKDKSFAMRWQLGKSAKAAVTSADSVP